MTLQDYQKEGWYGTDGSLDISLFEYGLACKDNDDGTIDVIFGIGVEETDCGDINYYRFDRWNRFGEDDLPLKDSWFELSDVVQFTGMSEDGWLKQNLLNKIADCISYYGTENIMGSSYYGFVIIDEDNIQKKED